jgi:hypothetical protein
MKGIIQYVLVFGISLLLAGALAAAALFAKPDLFHAFTHSGQTTAGRPDTTAVRSGARFDRPSLGDLMGADSLLLLKQENQQLRDSLRALAATLASEKGKPGQPETPAASPVQATGGDSLRATVKPEPAKSAERNSMAKVLESMQAENAARILRDMSDSEVKEILLVVKKRQAAKILAALEPDRAARIMR